MATAQRSLVGTCRLPWVPLFVSELYHWSLHHCKNHALQRSAYSICVLSGGIKVVEFYPSVAQVSMRVPRLCSIMLRLRLRRLCPSISEVVCES